MADLHDYVQRLVSTAPLLRPEQLDNLRVLLAEPVIHNPAADEDNSASPVPD